MANGRVIYLSDKKQSDCISSNDKSSESNSAQKEPWLESSTFDSLLPVGEHEEEIAENGQLVKHRGIYLLPNLFTTGALFCGFFAIIASINGRFEAAAISIFAAMLFDGLDGRIARLTNTQSKFGVEYDSLSDMVSFGVAPSLVVYNWGLFSLGKFGWAASFIFLACAALRLARFNTQAGTTDNRFFTGLASPPAAALLAGTVWFSYETGWQFEHLPLSMAVIAGIITVISGLLMIVNIPYYSFKDIDLHGRVPFVMMILVVLLFGLIMLDPPRVLLVMALVYAFSGPVIAIVNKMRKT